MNELGKFESADNEPEQRQVAMQVSEVFKKCIETHYGGAAPSMPLLDTDAVPQYDTSRLLRYFNLEEQANSLEKVGLGLKSNYYWVAPTLVDGQRCADFLSDMPNEAITPEFKRGIEQLLSSYVSEAARYHILQNQVEVVRRFGRLPQTCYDASEAPQFFEPAEIESQNELLANAYDFEFGLHHINADPTLRDRLHEFNRAEREGVFIDYCIAHEIGAIGNEARLGDLEFVRFGGYANTWAMLDTVIDNMERQAPQGETLARLQRTVMEVMNRRIGQLLSTIQSIERNKAMDPNRTKPDDELVGLTMSTYNLIRGRDRYAARFSR